MLWIVLEMVLGTLEYLAENPFYIWVIGAPLILLALGIWLQRQVARLRTEAARQDRQLEQARQRIESLQQRLAVLETPSDTPDAARTAAPQPDDALIVTTLDTAARDTAVQDAINQNNEPELSWDLPEELPAATATAPEEKPDSPAVTPPPSRPNPLQSAKDWLLGGNTVLRVGAVLLFLGLAFLLRYATEGVVVPIEARYAGVAGSAMALLGLGWWLRRRNTTFALMMQGTGIGVLYLTVLGAMRMHELLDPSMGFVLLIAVTLFSAMLAVTQNSLALACAATLGGFAAPIMASTGQGSHVTLFSYFALLNAGIFAIAWFKTWRLLNLIGFIGTFGIGFAWGLRAYTADLFWSVEPFLILFFLMYLAIGLLFARKKLQQPSDAPDHGSREAMLRWSGRQGDYVDGTLLFGTPIAGFGLQYALTANTEFGAAFSALALGLLYMGIARLLAGRAPGRALLLVETCLALGVMFATLAIPLGLGAQWTTSAWAIEGAAIFWLGMRQNRLLARGFGLLLQAAAGLAFIEQMDDWYFRLREVGDFWTPMIIALAGLLSALMVQRIKVLRYVSDTLLSGVLLAWGGLWWALALIIALMRLTPPTILATLLLLSIALSVALWSVLALRLNWPGLARLCVGLTPASWIALALTMFDYQHLFSHWAWLSWAALLIVHLWSLQRLAGMLPARALTFAHVSGCWLALVVLSLELFYGASELVVQMTPRNTWASLAGALLPSLYLWAMASSRQWKWPVAAYPVAYRGWAAAPVWMWLLTWFWTTNIDSTGNAEPLPYLPVLNPVELGLLFALLGIVSWTRNGLPQLGMSLRNAQRMALIIGGSSLFALITAMVVRSTRHWMGLEWYERAPLDSMLTQAALSIVWTLMALALMIGGHVRAWRKAWIAGAVLIGVVVAKLFLVELSNHGGLARIVSFIGVGILLLVVGYFAPLPPKKTAATRETQSL
ncbi:hypothetical protein ALQ04_04078 [Pseudomonas cichorii]|uniref:DUF2339 domain-containing protein n=1 Tax=Pseudomonas cichorii TaxID=36746 RepID=A0A3M4M317_PSECI|nr:DUF2339 domain-containing protein [Pseudomonas cichorii]RMQ47684.1 hypothetical protein ALQ04_04078 [Pseudomonas cichorii]